MNAHIADTAKAWSLPVRDVDKMFQWVRFNIAPERRGVVLAKMLRDKYKNDIIDRVR